MEPCTAHRLEGDVLPHDHLGHPWGAEVHRRPTLDHDDDVAERRDVCASCSRWAEEAADLRHAPREPDLVVEDPPGTASAREQLDLVGDACASRVHQVEDREELVIRRFEGADHLLDRDPTPRARLDGGIVRNHHHGAPVDAGTPGDHPIRCKGFVVVAREQAVLDERVRVDEEADAVAYEELALGRELVVVLLRSPREGTL